MRAFFVRHGESVYNVLGLANGDPAVPVELTENGRRQAVAAAETLRDAAIERVFVSQFQRARETAAIINRHHAAPVRVDARLNDRRSGFEGRPVGDYLMAVSDDPLDARPAGGESYREQIARVLAFLADLEADAAGNVLIVSHHEVLQIVNGHYTGRSELEMWRTPVANGQVLGFDLPSTAGRGR